MNALRPGAITLRTNLATSSITKALKDGLVGSELVKLDFCGPKTAHEGFGPMVRDGAFQAGELALATFLQAKAYGKKLSLLPAVMSGRLQHGCIAYNADFGSLQPKDIEGRRVAVRAYTQTTGLWVRGLLAREYGVHLDKVTWVTAEGAHLTEYADPPNVERLPEDAKPLGQLLLDGDVDALIIGMEAQPKAPQIRSLIPHPEEAAANWYKANGIMPINHLFVIDSDIARERPDVVRETYRMLEESKRLAGQPNTPDNLGFGYETIRKAVALGIELALEQKLITKRFSVDELFAETEAALA